MKGAEQIAAVLAEIENPTYQRPGMQRRHEWAKRLRAALTVQEGERGEALAKYDAEVLRAAADQLRAEGFDVEAVERLEERADRIAGDQP